MRWDLSFNLMPYMFQENANGNVMGTWMTQNQFWKTGRLLENLCIWKCEVVHVLNGNIVQSGIVFIWFSPNT